MGEIFWENILSVAFFLGMNVQDLISTVLTDEEIEQEQNSHCMKNNVPCGLEALDEEKAPLLEQVAKIFILVLQVLLQTERVSETCIS